MKIEIKANGIHSGGELQHFVRSRSELALHGLRDQIGLVSVVVGNSADSGDKGEMRCLLLIRLGVHQEVLVESENANLYAAIDQAFDAAGWSVARSLVRQQRELLQQQVEMIDGKYDDADEGQCTRSGRAA